MVNFQVEKRNRFIALTIQAFRHIFKGSNLGMIFSNGNDQIVKKVVVGAIFFFKYLLMLHLSKYHTIAFYSVF